MLEILICWAFAGLLGWLIGIVLRETKKEEGGRGTLEEEKEGAGGFADPDDLRDVMENGCESFLSEILTGAMKEARGRGVPSGDLLLLDCCQRHALAGDLETGTAVYLLERLGLGAWAEKAKGAGV